MFVAHSIRLRDPWQRVATEQGGVLWSRRFHRPTGLEPDDQLLLVVSGLPDDAAVRVNGQLFNPEQGHAEGGRDPFATGNVGEVEHFPVAKGPRPLPALPATFDLTSILRDANEIEIDVPLDPLRRLVEPRLGDTFPYDVRLAVMGNS